MNNLSGVSNGSTSRVQSTGSGSQAGCCSGFGRCVKSFSDSLNCVATCFKACYKGCVKCASACLKGYLKCTDAICKCCIQCTNACSKDSIHGMNTCIKSCISGIKYCCKCCVNCTKSSLLGSCDCLKKAIECIENQIVKISDWNFIGPRLPLVHYFVLCIPLKVTGHVVAFANLIYSILCFSLLMKIANQNNKYLEVYANKMDVFVVMVIYLSSTVLFLVTCTFLFVGTFLRCRTLVEIYLWSVVLHVFVNIVSAIVVSIYCIFNQQCFTGSGLVQSLVGLLFCLMYTMFWIYIISSVNSMMENPPPPSLF